MKTKSREKTAKVVEAEIEDGTRSYLNSISKVSLLNAEEEKTLARAYRDGDEAAKDKLFNANLRLVVSIAKHYHMAGAELADFISAGNIGLSLAIDHFEPEKGWRFSTYATWKIRQKIGRMVNENSRSIRLPSYICDNQRKIQKVLETFGLDPEYLSHEDLDLIAQETGFKIPVILKIMGMSKPILSLDANLDEDRKLEDIIIDNNIDLLESAIRAEECEVITKLLTVLLPREKDIIQRRFGLGRPEQTLEEIGNDLNITRERVRQLETKALKKLHAPAHRRKLHHFFEGEEVNEN